MICGGILRSVCRGRVARACYTHIFVHSSRTRLSSLRGAPHAPHAPHAAGPAVQRCQCEVDHPAALAPSSSRCEPPLALPASPSSSLHAERRRRRSCRFASSTGRVVSGLKPGTPSKKRCSFWPLIGTSACPDQQQRYRCRLPHHPPQSTATAPNRGRVLRSHVAGAAAALLAQRPGARWPGGGPRTQQSGCGARPAQALGAQRRRHDRHDP